VVVGGNAWRTGGFRQAVTFVAEALNDRLSAERGADPFADVVAEDARDDEPVEERFGG